MAERLLMGIDPTGEISLKISKPGQNAETASPGQLNFNSDWAAFGVFLRGTHNWTWPNADSGNYSQNVNFGASFSTPPICQFEALINGVWQALPGYGAKNFSFTRNVRIYNNQNTWVRTATYTMEATATNAQIQFRGSFNAQHASGLIRDGFDPPNMQIRYTVFTYNF